MSDDTDGLARFNLAFNCDSDPPPRGVEVLLPGNPALEPLRRRWRWRLPGLEAPDACAVRFRLSRLWAAGIVVLAVAMLAYLPPSQWFFLLLAKLAFGHGLSWTETVLFLLPCGLLVLALIGMAAGAARYMRAAGGVVFAGEHLLTFSAGAFGTWMLTPSVSERTRVPLDAVKTAREHVWAQLAEWFSPYRVETLSRGAVARVAVEERAAFMGCALQVVIHTCDGRALPVAPRECRDRARAAWLARELAWWAECRAENAEDMPLPDAFDPAAAKTPTDYFTLPDAGRPEWLGVTVGAEPHAARRLRGLADASGRPPGATACIVDLYPLGAPWRLTVFAAWILLVAAVAVAAPVYFWNGSTGVGRAVLLTWPLAGLIWAGKMAFDLARHGRHRAWLVLDATRLWAFPVRPAGGPVPCADRGRVRYVRVVHCRQGEEDASGVSVAMWGGEEVAVPFPFGRRGDAQWLASRLAMWANKPVHEDDVGA